MYPHNIVLSRHIYDFVFVYDLLACLSILDLVGVNTLVLGNMVLARTGMGTPSMVKWTFFLDLVRVTTPGLCIADFGGPVLLLFVLLFTEVMLFFLSNFEIGFPSPSTTARPPKRRLRLLVLVRCNG